MSKNPTNRKVGEVMKVEIKEGTENIPKSTYEELARYFLPEILAYYEKQERNSENENTLKLLS